MARGNWMERGVAWHEVAGNNGIGDDKPMISFVNNLEGVSWYDVSVTAALPDTLENREPRLGIRSASPAQVLAHPCPGCGHVQIIRCAVCRRREDEIARATARGRAWDEYARELAVGMRSVCPGGARGYPARPGRPQRR